VTFYLSKIFWFLAQPISLTIVLIAAAVALQVFAWRRFALAATLMALAVLGMSALTTIGGVMMSPLEERFARPASLPERVDGIIMLGGAVEGLVTRAKGGHEFNDAGDRFVETAALAIAHPQARILISGGNGSAFIDVPGDADVAPLLFSRLGVDPARIISEAGSRNTDENVRLSIELAKPQAGETWLLVTSAFHMPRSVGLFRKAGWQVTPWPADYRAAGRERLRLCDEFTRCLSLTSTAMREWVGLVAYWMMGRIDTPFPAP